MTKTGRYFLVQMIMLAGDDDRVAYSAQVVAAPSRSGAARSSAGSTTEDAFLAALPETPYRDALEEIFTTCSALGLVFAWGSKGASIRLQTSDRTEPVSIAWILPEGAQWYGINHLGMGYDIATAGSLPSVEPALESFASKVHAIPGAKPATTKALNASMFAPDQVVANKAAIIATLEDLVTSASPAD